MVDIDAYESCLTRQQMFSLLENNHDWKGREKFKLTAYSSMTVPVRLSIVYFGATVLFASALLLQSDTRMPISTQS